jgi:hypothetical protein
MAALDIHCSNIPPMVVVQLDIVVNSFLSGKVIKPARNTVFLLGVKKVVH